MGRQTSALCEPMTGSLNIHPPTQPHLLSVIQQSLTDTQTVTDAYISWLPDQLLPMYSQTIIKNITTETRTVCEELLLRTIVG